MKKESIDTRLFIVCGIIALGCFLYLNRDKVVLHSTGKTKVKEKPWFASYVDVTLMPQFDFEQVKGNLVLSFVVASNR